MFVTQYCRSQKVRSSQHSGVEYYYSKCTPISGAREFDADNQVYDGRTDLQDLIRFLDNENRQNVAVDQETWTDAVVESPAEKMAYNVSYSVEKGAAFDDRAEADEFQDLEKAADEFQNLEKAADFFQEEEVAVDVVEDEEIVEKAAEDEFEEREFIGDAGGGGMYAEDEEEIME